jgi:hypothetical protein
MHIHASQLNLNAELYAAQAAARAEAKMAAQQTRRKLISFASALAGEVDDPADCVVRLGGQGEPQGQSNQQDGQGETGENVQYAQADTEKDPFSGWA